MMVLRNGDSLRPLGSGRDALRPTRDRGPDNRSRASRSSTATALAAVLLLAAGCPPPLGTEESASAARAPALDIDTADCARTVAGRIFARGGALYFDDRPADAEPVSSWWDECPGDPGEADRLGTLTWDAGETLLSTLRGSFSALLPGPWPGTAVAVRSYAAGWGRNGDESGPDALGAIALPSLTFMPWWSPGGRIHLVGIRGARALVLADETGGPRLLAVTRDGTVAARSPVLDLPTWIARTEEADVGLPWLAPLDADRLVLRCGATGLCLATLGETEITIAPTGATAEELAWSPTLGPLIARPEDRCAALGGVDPSAWAAVAPAECPEDMVDPWLEERALPVDGVPTSGVRGEVTACLARSVLELPPLRDPSRESAQDPEELLYPGAGVIVLSDHDWDQGRLTLDLLVRGVRLGVAFTFLDGVGAATVRRDFGLALPPGNVSVRPAEQLGRALYRIRIDAPIPFPGNRPGDCWLGRLVLRVWGDEYGPNEQGFANRYWEFGTCE
jgi:hypothetical protein